MGRGNVCPNKNGGVFYVDYENLDYYVDKCNPDKVILFKDVDDFERYSYDEVSSQDMYNRFKDELKANLMKTFKSLQETQDRSLLENEIFSIRLKDNEWSVAVLLEPKEQPYWKQGNYEMIQARLAKFYLSGIQKALFKQFDTIGLYTGPWTSGTLTREEFEASNTM